MSYWFDGPPKLSCLRLAVSGWIRRAAEALSDTVSQEIERKRTRSTETMVEVGFPAFRRSVRLVPSVQKKGGRNEGKEGEGRLTSTARSPGRSEKRKRSYAFAQMSASGRTSNASTATSSGLVGCRSADKSELSIAVKDASMSRSCAAPD